MDLPWKARQRDNGEIMIVKLRRFVGNGSYADADNDADADDEENKNKNKNFIFWRESNKNKNFLGDQQLCKTCWHHFFRPSNSVIMLQENQHQGKSATYNSVF